MMTEPGKILLSVVGLIAAVAAAWVLLLAPKRDEAAKLQTQVVAAELQRDGALARAADAERARAAYKRDYATVARLGKAVPVSADVPSLVYQLETAARRAKVDFRAVTVLDSTADASTPAAGAATRGGGVTPAPFSFKFEGTYFGLQKLLAAVDRFSRVKGTQMQVNGRLLTIDGLTLSAGRGGLPQISGTITARAYVADLPDQLPSASQPAAGTPTVTPASQETPTP
jgi:Tfp pilus assembly protein PilO